MNETVGFVRTVDPAALQRKVDGKARDLSRYCTSVESAILLVVADGSRASGFLDLAPDTVIEPRGFDHVYFQRYPEGTRLLAGGK